MLLASNVVNWGKIQKRVYKSNIRLPLETPERDVEKVINRIRFILKYNNEVVRDCLRSIIPTFVTPKTKEALDDTDDKELAKA